MSEGVENFFENFLKSCHIYVLDTLGVKNFDEIALSLTVKEIEALLCFCIFGENWSGQLEIYTGHFTSNFSKMAAILNFRIFAKSGKSQNRFYLLYH